MTDNPVRQLQSRQPPFAHTLGVVYTEVTAERVVAELVVRAEICTTQDRLHGGAIMTLADTVGAMATHFNLAEGVASTTMESKTNFFSAIPLGDVAVAEAIPLHKGRTTQVWQTRISRKSDGRLAAIVTQTQMILRSS